MDEAYQQEIKIQMRKTIEVIKIDLSTLRTGRATPQLIEQIEIVTYSGTQKLKLREIASINATDAITLIVHAYDPSTIDDIVKSILVSNIGLNPIIDNGIIRISIPPLSQERRIEYTKLAHAKLEAGKIMIRQIRHNEMNHLKKAFENKEINEDDKKKMEKIIQTTTDEAIAEIDHTGKLKIKELMQV